MNEPKPKSKGLDQATLDRLAREWDRNAGTGLPDKIGASVVTTEDGQRKDVIIVQKTGGEIKFIPEEERTSDIN